MSKRIFSDADKSAMDRWVASWTKSTSEMDANLREWCEAILCELAGPDMEPSDMVVDQLTQVVECRAKQIASRALAVSEDPR